MVSYWIPDYCALNDIKGKSYMKDSGDFVNKIKELQSITDGTTLVTSDAVP